MSRKRRRGKWIVQREFELNRLSQAILEQAYAKIVPQHIRIIEIPAGEMKERQQMRQQPRARSVK